MFKVGDYVIRTGDSVNGILKGVCYVIKDIDNEGNVNVHGNPYVFHACNFELVKKETPLAIQHGGTHYKKLKIQPVEYIMANDIPYMEGNVIKYVSRWKDKGGIEDLKKAKHYLEILIENEQKND